jgi:hypothetical protein
VGNANIKILKIAMTALADAGLNPDDRLIWISG